MPLREEQQMVLDLVRELARDEIAPKAAAIDHDNAFPEAIFARFRELNLLGLPAPERYGGIDGDPVTAALVLETLAEASPSVAIVVGLHWTGVLEPILRFAPESLREEWAPRLAKGEVLGACFGSLAWADALLPTPAATAAGAYLVGFVEPAPAQPLRRWTVVERRAEGPGVSPSTEPLGWRGSGYGSIEAKNLQRAASAFPESACADATAFLREGVALAVASVALGTGRAAHGRAVKYANERRQFGKLIVELGAIRQMLGQSAAALEDAARAVLGAATARAEGRPWGVAALQAKHRAAEAAVLASRHAIQIHGGYGFMSDYHVERDARDAQCAYLFCGGPDPAADLAARSGLSALPL